MRWFLLRVSPTRLPSSLHIPPVNRHRLLSEPKIALSKCCSIIIVQEDIANVKRRYLIYNKSSQHAHEVIMPLFVMPFKLTPDIFLYITHH